MTETLLKWQVGLRHVASRQNTPEIVVEYLLFLQIDFDIAAEHVCKVICDCRILLIVDCFVLMKLARQCKGLDSLKLTLL